MSNGENTRLIISNILTFVAGYALHLLKSKRDDRTAEKAAERARQDRKTSLRAYLNVWDSEVAGNIATFSAAGNARIGIPGQFASKRSTLIEKTTELEPHIGDNERTRFAALVKKITDMQPGNIDGQGGRDTLLKAIRDLVSFLKEN